MVILGNIIKTALEFTDKVIPAYTPVKDQKEMLPYLLRKARDTAFGRHYQFEKLLQEPNIRQAFSQAVPYHDYESIHQRWWKRQMEGEANVAWPGLPKYYAVTAGTTGVENKRIPATDDMLEAIRKASLLQILAMANFDLPAPFFEKEVMMLGGTTTLTKRGFYEEGEISGIAAANIPQWFMRFYRPGRQISDITDWDEKVDIIARKAPEWDIGSMAGIPSWNELMLKRVIEVNKVDTIHDIWPNFRVFASGGVAFSPYRKTFDSLSGKPLTYIDTYLASEGFIAFQTRPNDEMAMALATNSGLYFEFIPFESENIDEEGGIRQGAPSLTLEQVQEGVDYVLVVSSVAGAWRYMIGDTIRFTSKQKAEIVISGRTRHYLNVAGTKLSDRQMNSVIRHLEEAFGLLIPEYTVTAIREEQGYVHHWYLGIEGRADDNELAQALDQYLKSINKSYSNARNHAMKTIRLSSVSPGVFYAWNEQEQKKGGQVKMPRVMKEEEFARWRDFAAKANGQF